MTDTHYTLMATLQNQRDQLARFVWLFAHDEYKHERTLAVDALDITQYAIQRGITRPTLMAGKLRRIAENTTLIETLNATIVAMPDAAWADSEVAT